jgi:dTMP kinase
LGGDDSRWSAEAEALLFAAARADHVEKTIRPALEQGHWVISDRFLDSSLAYQGGALALGIERVRDLYRFACGEFLPDRTLVLVLDEGAKRANARDLGGADRIGGRSADFFHRVETAFRIIAAEEPERVRLVDASGTPEEVTQRLVAHLEDFLP